MRRIIRQVGLPETFTQLNPPVTESQARQAFLAAHWIRRRFTLGDLLFFVSWDRVRLWDAVREELGQPPGMADRSSCPADRGERPRIGTYSTGIRVRLVTLGGMLRSQNASLPSVP